MQKWRDTMMSACVWGGGGHHAEVEGYHEYTGGCAVHQGFHTNSMVFSITLPTLIMVSPGVLMISP